ncbi:hypothetical protein [Paenibacillus sp. FSL K6-2524]|uniref:hypothetical protein n=1 Tax=Paenibacillus sp. FSL K6-2524 TaxID=2954516 RepID=UPI0030F8A84A
MERKRSFADISSESASASPSAALSEAPFYGSSTPLILQKEELDQFDIRTSDSTLKIPFE